MSAVISGLLGGAVAAVLAALAQRSQRAARMTEDGWRVLRPGWFIHATFVGCVALSSLITFSLITGGSTRSDAQTQNLYALALAIAFGLGALYVAWTSYARTLAWKGNDLRFRTITGRDEVRGISHVRSIRKSDARGDYRICFLDGSKLVFSAYLHGARELVEQLRQSAHDD
jgi:hypothetical protein